MDVNILLLGNVLLWVTMILSQLRGETYNSRRIIFDLHRFVKAVKKIAILMELFIFSVFKLLEKMFATYILVRDSSQLRLKLRLEFRPWESYG